MEDWNDKTEVILTSVILCSCCGMLGIALGAFLFFGNICNSLEIPLLCETECISNCAKMVNETWQNTTNNTINNITHVWDNNVWWNLTNLTLNLTNHTTPGIVTIQNTSNFKNISALYAQSIRISPQKDEIEISHITSGEAVAISISCVFIFIGCIVGSAWYIIYKPNPIKKMITNATRSEPIPIKLTPEELKLCQVNPIIKASENSIFLQAIEIIKQAVQKDSEHYYPEALKLYEKGIDMFVQYMKIEVNGATRFELAKKVDIYLKRANYIQVHLLDNTKKLPETPKPPIIRT